ncbi:hypothetical protein NXK88_002868 [Enterococcus hirae]|uniref:hypothetical protein n=1 Tax=Enterococcus hirae TaxID=1354 RepID=UPI0020736D6B|nr:hypothetical protein [Enterococcus hirae]EMF0203577.1 hypothetical protein [Enterococcus hirae]
MKNNIWIKIIEKNCYQKLIQMGNSEISIIKWEKKRVFSSIIVAILGFISGVVLKNNLVCLGGILLTFFLYFSKIRMVNSMYKQYVFMRQLQFSKFTRLLLPYLNKEHQSVNLYGVFAKIVPRLDYEEDRVLLMQLMQEMLNNPGEIQPFIDYANKSSGSDLSILFMSTVFDIQQGSTNSDVINGLDQLASEELLLRIDMIVDNKLRKFTFIPTKMTMVSILLIIGFVIGYAITVFQSISLNI